MAIKCACGRKFSADDNNAGRLYIWIEESRRAARWRERPGGRSFCQTFVSFQTRIVTLRDTLVTSTAKK